jgi:DNA repair photolyase
MIRPPAPRRRSTAVYTMREPNVLFRSLNKYFVLPQWAGDECDTRLHLLLGVYIGFNESRRMPAMSDHSKIEWTDATWNPVRGCTKISAGCKHCYAETFAERFRGVPGHPYEQGFDLRLVPDKLLEPLKWAKSKMVFVNSMSDLFQDGVDDDYIEFCAKVMVAAHWHTFQVLTKRSQRMRDLLQSRLQFAANCEHIWWGVSVENRPRIAFLSIEPLLQQGKSRHAE